MFCQQKSAPREKNLLKHLKIQFTYGNIQTLGGVAQLGERLNGIQEVMGSIPTISTKQTRPAFMVGLVCFCLYMGSNPRGVRL